MKSDMLSFRVSRLFGADRPTPGVVNQGVLSSVGAGSHGRVMVSGMVVSTGLDLQDNIAAELATFGIDINCLASRLMINNEHTLSSRILNPRAESSTFIVSWHLDKRHLSYSRSVEW